MTATDERMFTLISYRRNDLVFDAEWLNGAKVARWLAARTDEQLEAIADQAADHLWEGETLSYALKEAVQSAYAAAHPPAGRSGKRSGAGDRVVRGEKTA